MPKKRYKQTEEHKKRISLANKGRKNPRSSNNLGRYSKKGNKLSEDECRKIGIASSKKIRTPEWRKKMSIARSGNKCNFWKGGLSDININIRNSVEYRIWRESVFKRDNFTCVLCGRFRKKGDRVILNADHIKPFSLYPELRFELSNGRTLCKECHFLTPTFGKNVVYQPK